ncbi:MAG TPA: hypothetical protein PLP05_03665 [Sedimentisphaerales bacterium]|nr:hypothetical protein [Sedimentisphaerales bacterium]
MKNSKEYSDKIEKLYKTLTKKYGKVNPVTHNTILEALIYGAISEHLTDKGTQDTFANILNYFTDFNELRVSRTEEIVEIINYKDDGLAREVARSLIRVLASVFARFNNIDLEGLKKLGKRPAKQAIEQLEGITVFMTDYCMLTALGGHAIPLSVAMIDYLVDQDLVYPSSDQQEIEGFLTRLISANQGYEFYSLLRRESEGYKPKKKRAVVKVEEVHKEAPKETTKEVTTADVIEELPKKEEVVTPKTTTKKVVKKVTEKKTAKKTKTKAVKEKTTRKTSKK